MKDNYNTIYNVDFMVNNLPDGCANLIIADPPYFQIKGDFDFAWDSFDEYLKDVEKWAIECKRLLSENGTLFWYGDDKRIAYAQIIFDKHFNLLNNLVWHKGENFMGLNKSDGLRSFAPCTERVLMYDKINDCKDGFEPSYIRNHFQDYLMNERKKAGITTKDINNICGYSEKTQNKIINNEKNWMFITEKSYNFLSNSTKFFKKSYEDLRREYEDLRRPFDNFLNINEVMRFNNESAMNTQYSHPTRKPEKLTRALILTSSRPGDVVLVPFAGSGTECAATLLESRKFIGYEIDKKYFDIASKRIDHARSSTIKMFS